MSKSREGVVRWRGGSGEERRGELGSREEVLRWPD